MPTKKIFASSLCSAAQRYRQLQKGIMIRVAAGGRRAVWIATTEAPNWQHAQQWAAPQQQYRVLRPHSTVSRFAAAITRGGQSRRGDLHGLFVAFSHTSAARRRLLWCFCGPCAKRHWLWHDADRSQSIDCITTALRTGKRRCAGTAASCTSDTQVSQPAKPFAQPWTTRRFRVTLQWQAVQAADELVGRCCCAMIDGTSANRNTPFRGTHCVFERLADAQKRGMHVSDVVSKDASPPTCR
jgi:hypothetical protein